ncbi:hypothetical protein OCU04_001805 [Sclerotinia nivalis]|uniref:Uncharacterized protein n=1 Tax=Sclerotinia nivalis TaxID=352851 RepID=A0A9X0AZB2_9HELO|nr:hypothetical protein OCU04_001805 [Sclerotinia nivalis]
MATNSSASGAAYDAAETMVTLNPRSSDSSGGSDRHCKVVSECDMCAQYLEHVTVNGGEPLDEDGLAGAKILASMMQDRSGETTCQDDTDEYATEYALDGEDRLHGSMFERLESGGEARRRMAPPQPSHQRKFGAGAARKRKAGEQGESSAQGFRRGQAKRATGAGATGVNITPKPALSPEERKRAMEKKKEALRAENQRVKEEMFPRLKKKR